MQVELSLIWRPKRTPISFHLAADLPTNIWATLVSQSGVPHERAACRAFLRACDAAGNVATALISPTVRPKTTSGYSGHGSLLRLLGKFYDQHRICSTGPFYDSVKGAREPQKIRTN
jgi:hypothetical protein